MSKENKQKDKLPFGLTEDQARPVEIKAIKKTRKGFEIDLKPSIEKEDGAEYYYRFSKGLYNILRNKRAIYTPGGKKVTVANEALAQRTVDHMNMYGEEYENPSSIVNFVFSDLDFFKNQTKEELDSTILADYETDWVLKTNGNTFSEWCPSIRIGVEQRGDFEAWLETLTKHQTGSVVIMGACFSSVNTAYLLSNLADNAKLKKLASAYFDAKYKHAKEYNAGFMEFWQKKEIVKIFENYLFWQGLGI